MLFSLLLACSTPVSKPPSAAAPELPPFEDAAAEQRYGQLAAWADGRGWTASPLRRGGALLERRWVRGAPGKGEVLPPNTARATLGVFAYDDPKSSYGLEWSAAISDESGEGLSLFLVSGARGFTPDQMRIDLHPSAGAPVELGAPLTWSVGERVLQTTRPEGLEEVLAKLAEYQGTGLARAAELDLERLEAVVLPVLDQGDYFVCDYGPSPGGGVPGPCRPRAPTETERAENRQLFDTDMARRRSVLGDGASWAALLAEVAPVL